MRARQRRRNIRGIILGMDDAIIVSMLTKPATRRTAATQQTLRALMNKIVKAVKTVEEAQEAVEAMKRVREFFKKRLEADEQD